MGHSGALYRREKSRKAPHQRQATPEAIEGSKGKRGPSAPGDGSEKRGLVARGRAVHADGLVRNIALAAFHTIVDADLADRTQGFVVKRGYSESSPQLFVKLPQVFKVRCQCRHFKPFVSQKEFLVTRVPQAGEFFFLHDRRPYRLSQAPIGVLPEFRSAATLLHSGHAARAAQP